MVWAHDFRRATEVSTHLIGSTGPGSHGGDAFLPRQVADGPTGYSMEIPSIGSRLAEDFRAAGGPGPRVLRITDATLWPDPAVDGPFYLHTTKADRDQQNNLWKCTARTGTALTVTYVPSTGQPFTPSQRDWLAGDHIGHQCGVNWSRLFSALSADSNGTGVDDINKAGVILRSTKEKARFPWGLQAFGYGWYGRPEYHSEFASWRPSDSGANAIDNILRTNVWDGDEFYIQFRVKIDPRFWSLNTIDPNSEDQKYGRKMIMLQSQMTVPQQITTGISPSNRYWIPSTPQNPHALAAYSFGGGLAGRMLAKNADGTGSYQPGSPFETTALSNSFMPAGSAWEWSAGEWITFLWRVKPGLRWSRDNPGANGVRNTVVEIKAAREGESRYTTLFSKSDEAIIYGSSGPEEDRWTSALPGYNAISLTGYLNTDLGSVVPAAAYYVRWTQVIFSKQPIPVPAV